MQLPSRPSLESIRKQAKKLARDRAVPLREAQLALARDYGFPGWRDLANEVMRRAGNSLDVAGAQARRVIHENNPARLRELLSAHPALVVWRNSGGQTLLEFATEAYGDAGDPFRERMFTRLECAEMLIDAGAVVDRKVVDAVIFGRASNLLQLLVRKDAIPQGLEYLAALGDLTRITALFADPSARPDDLETLDRALTNACRFQHKDVAGLLLTRAIDRDPELGARIAAGPGTGGFIEFLCGHSEVYGSPWQTYLTCKVLDVVKSRDVAAFARLIESDPALLSEASIDLQNRIVETATFNKAGEIIEALFDRSPALLRAEPPPATRAITYAFEYAQIKLLPLLTRVWPLPDDLPHAAGVGDLDRVRRRFADGRTIEQHDLDLALAWAVMNNHFETADLLLARGADVNTRWSSHEPASILHELVWHENYEAMQFLIDRGIDMTIHDYRWNATAEGWARYAAKNDQLADFLAAAAARRR